MNCQHFQIEMNDMHSVCYTGFDETFDIFEFIAEVPSSVLPAHFLQHRTNGVAHDFDGDVLGARSGSMKRNARRQ